MLDGEGFPCSLTPVAVSGGLSFVQLAAGATHTSGLTRDGTTLCWGLNANGQLGDDSTTSRTAPVPVAKAPKLTAITAGAKHTCGLTSAGAAHCWGSNARGQLGDGSTTSRSVPVAAGGALSFRQVTAGGFGVGHTCGLTARGEAQCWGDNERGQLGTGTTDVTPHPSPAPVKGTLTFTGLTAGLGRHTCGSTSAGAAHCWGENTHGALGNGTSTDSSAPVAVAGGVAFAQLMAGGFIGHTCGLASNGAGYCWGENEKGQVGDGSTEDRTQPAAISGGLTFTGLTAGFRHTCGRTSTGDVYCWGSGGAGQLGNNATVQSAVPVKVVLPP
jgi:alpha-tubulin suppressor-like RCC1 family protein